MLILFLDELNVDFSLTLDGWSNRNLKGFHVVIAHYIDISALSSKSILLMILDVTCGAGVRTNLFEHLKYMDIGTLTRLENVISDNGSNAVGLVKHLFQLINASVGYEQMSNCNHVLRQLFNSTCC